MQSQVNIYTHQLAIDGQASNALATQHKKYVHGASLTQSFNNRNRIHSEARTEEPRHDGRISP